MLPSVGDFNSKEMKATLTVLFSKWKKSKEEESPASKRLSSLKESRVLLVNKEDARKPLLYRCARSKQK
jgi:predicted Zn-dependent peptidase